MTELSMKTVFHSIALKPCPSVIEEEDEDLADHVTGRGSALLVEEQVEPLEEEPARTDSDDDWDTDLEDDDNPVRRRRIVEGEGTRPVYLAACRQLGIVPATCFIKGLETRAVNLNFQGLGPLGTRAVATALVKDTQTTSLYLAGNFIGDAGIKYLCEMLRENEFIAELDISENDLETYALAVLSEMFRENDTLINLKLSGNRFKAADAQYVAAILTLPHYVGLRSLDLSHNEFGDEGGKIIGHAIGDNETITYLNLSWNQIRKAGSKCIATGLAENNTLKTLDLSTNGVGNEGAVYLAKALLNNRKLEELNLNSNRVGLDGTAALFKAICKNENLKTIRLSNNPLTSQGPIAALKLLQQSDVSVLQELEIADACVPREFFKILEEIQVNRPEFTVHLGGFMDGKDMCKADVKSIRDGWKKDAVLVFMKFVEEKNLRTLDLFKIFDKDRSCSLSREEMKIGLTKVGCPLTDTQLEELICALDEDNSGEIDIDEFLDGHDKHRRRLTRYMKYDTPTTPSPAQSTDNQTSGDSHTTVTVGSTIRPETAEHTTNMPIVNMAHSGKPHMSVPYKDEPIISKNDFTQEGDDGTVTIMMPKSFTVA